MIIEIVITIFLMILFALLKKKKALVTTSITGVILYAIIFSLNFIVPKSEPISKPVSDNALEDTTSSEDIKTTPLFEDVFMRFYKEIGTSTFEELEKATQNINYRREIEENSILFFDDKGNYAFLGFYDKNNIPTLYVIAYNNDAVNIHTPKESENHKDISATNNFHELSEIKYQITDSQHPTGGDVDSLEELKKIMFGE